MHAERIRRLVLPPAWTEVHVAPAAGARLQAIGRDRAGRWQYRYHPEFLRRRPALRILPGGAGRGRPEPARPAGATAKPARRAARRAER